MKNVNGEKKVVASVIAQNTVIFKIIAVLWITQIVGHLPSSQKKELKGYESKK